MNTTKMIAKRLRKGMTLLELVVAMALASIIFLGAGTALFAVNRVSKRETKDHVTLSDAKNLATAIDLLVKQENRGTMSVTSETDNLGKEGCDMLFTIGDVNYGLDHKVFGIIDSGTHKIEGDNVKYTASYDMYISINKPLSGKFTEFVVHYGDNYASSLSLVEKI